MSEIAEHIQAPAVPEFSSPEIPVQPSKTQPTETVPPAQDETVLTAEITELWRLHSDYAASMRSQSQNLRSLRAELGKRLSEMKQLLARPGRGGEWSGWLRERRIPRATADRLVSKHERSLHPDGNCLIEAITEPTDEEIKALLEKTVPKLGKVLHTPASAYRFLELLASSFVLEHWDAEEGFFLVKPSARTAVEQSVPAEAQGESVPVTADLPAKGVVESTGASMTL